MSRIAVLGVGKVGTAIARAALAAGHEVTVAGSGDPEPVRFITEVMAPGVAVAAAADAVDGSDLVVLSIPLPKLGSLDPEVMRGRIIVDAMNHWEPTDGALPDIFAGAASTSEAVARHLAGARVVKALNHIGYHEMEADQRPQGALDRRGLAAVSDDREAAERVAEFVESLGFDVVAATPLRVGRGLEPGSEIFAGSFTAAEIVQRMDSAHRR
ncbi:MAG: NAD(P)-binding domain-containing protein [Leucobacter sp.]|nr:NAD(P)-binding domain-containing protein [Leucobacter sp.]